MGIITFSVVPGTTVLFTTTVWFFMVLNAFPISSAADLIYVRLIDPSSFEGVPTQIKEQSESVIPSRIEVLVEIREVFRSSRASRPGSYIGDRQDLISFIFLSSMSMKQTSFPSSAKAGSCHGTDISATYY